MDTKTATPAQIDGRLAAIQMEMARLDNSKERNQTMLDDFAAADGYQLSFSRFSPENIEAARVAIAAADEARQTLIAETMVLNEEFSSRGGWTRFYLVTNSGGHVHWTTGCGTCFPTTEFAWLTDYSGMTHADFVEHAGSKACTVCFPDAPVDVLRRKSTIETAEAKARREERAAKAAAKAAAEVIVNDYIDWGRKKGTKTFKTVRAVTNDIAGNLSSLCWWGTEHPSSPEWMNNVEVARAALVARGEEYDYDKALSNARKKITREGGESKF